MIIGGIYDVIGAFFILMPILQQSYFNKQKQEMLIEFKIIERKSSPSVLYSIEEYVKLISNRLDNLINLQERYSEKSIDEDKKNKSNGLIGLYLIGIGISCLLIGSIFEF